MGGVDGAAANTNNDITCVPDTNKVSCNNIPGVNSNALFQKPNADEGKCNCDAKYVQHGTDAATKCDTCVAGKTNWPYCDENVATPVETNCDDAKHCHSHGKCNPKYDEGNGTLDTKAKVTAALIDANHFSQCGDNICASTEQCCTAAAVTNSRPTTASSPASGFTGVTEESKFCARIGMTCCGTTACNPGQVCLNAALNLCTSVHEKTYNLDKTPCYGNGNQLKNGTVIGATSAVNWCAAHETCCDGICCGNGEDVAHSGECVDAGTRLHDARTDPFGYDYRWRGATNFAMGGSKFCNPFHFNAMHGMRIVFIPLLLTFAYLLAIALGAGAGSPMPVKAIGCLMLVLCIFQAYHYEWQWGTFIALTVVYTLFGTGASGNKPSWTPLAVFFVQLLCFSIVFRVPILDVFAPASLGMPNFGQLHDRNVLEKCAETYSYFKEDYRAINHDEEIEWVSIPELRFGMSIKNQGNPLGATSSYGMLGALNDLTPETTIGNTAYKGYYPLSAYHGYCAAGWLVTMDFFIALNSFLLLALMVFSAKFFLDGPSSGGAGKSSVVPQEVQVP